MNCWIMNSHSTFICTNVYLNSSKHAMENPFIMMNCIHFCIFFSIKNCASLSHVSLMPKNPPFASCQRVKVCKKSAEDEICKFSCILARFQSYIEHSSLGTKPATIDNNTDRRRVGAWKRHNLTQTLIVSSARDSSSSMVYWPDSVRSS